MINVSQTSDYWVSSDGNWTTDIRLEGVDSTTELTPLLFQLLWSSILPSCLVNPTPECPTVCQPPDCQPADQLCPGLVPIDCSTGVSTWVSTRVSAGVSSGISAGVSARVSAGVNARVSAGVSARVSAGVSAGVSSRINYRVSSRINCRVSSRISCEVSRRVSTWVSTRVSNKWIQLTLSSLWPLILDRAINKLM